MAWYEIVLGAALLIFSIVIVLVVVFQEGRQANLSGTIAGGADSFLSKNKARTVDAFLARWTKVIAIAFFVLTIGVHAIFFLAKK